ncbi:GNAT family N-acetyltransferase [Paraburkholderia aspalathi]|nr:GNAT family N-acetyltransferase [Paraburkholderia aspalathi]MDN7169064.1 GNAT family N-acetyltransferase [Paraburkholderia sp. SECH2]MDQ6397551.1 GNAT family N-acetyltransferase [Paraburkholderia aspalathi]
MHSGGTTSGDVAVPLARYRYQRFVKDLGWDLPSEHNDSERDQYDRNDTVYIIARDEDDSVLGCARLLPTTGPYLLQEIFPDLVASGVPLPCSPDVWEISRFAANPLSGGGPDGASGNYAIRPLLAAVVQCALTLGARQLVGVTYVSMERLFRRIGVHMHRAGPPQRIDDRPVIGFWFDLDDQTQRSLGIEPIGNAFSRETERSLVQNVSP